MLHFHPIEHFNDFRFHAPKLPTPILLSALSILPVNVFLPSLSNIAREFNVDYALVSLSLAGYAAVAAALQLILAPLSDRFGRRPIVLAGLAIFIVASVGCAVAHDIWSFLAFRLLQSAVISGHAVALAAIRDTTSREQAASRIGYVAMAWAIAPMLGPSLGGVLDETVGWRAIFWGLGLVGMVLFVLCWCDFEETNKNRSHSIGEQLCAYPGLLGARRFWGYVTCLAFSSGAFYAFLAGAPLVATAAFGLSPAELGVFMGMITAGFMFGSFLSGRYARRFALSANMIAGRCIACFALVVGLVLAIAGTGHAMAMFGPCILVGAGNGVTMPSANSGAVSVRADLAGSASGLAGAITVAGGATLSLIAGTLVSQITTSSTLLCVMLLSVLVALGAAVFVHAVEERPSMIGQ